MTIDTDGRTDDRRADFDEVYGDWDEVRSRIAPGAGAGAAAGAGAPVRLGPRSRRPCAAPSATRPGSPTPRRWPCSTRTARNSTRWPRWPTACARDTVGDDVTYVVTRNINFTNVCYTGCRFCAFAQRRTDADAYTLSLAQVADRAQEAWEVGATEVCMQGGIHPDLPGTAYFDIAGEVKRRTPGMHVHAFSPMEVMNGASRTGMSVREWLTAAREAGVDSMPGTAAEILDDEVRWVLTKGKLPAAAWVEVITTAHELGIRTSSTMMYGHVDTPAHWVGHLRVLRGIQERTGGFTEFVPLPFIHTNSPIYLAGLARPGPTRRENRAVHALARLMLHGAIDNIQCSLGQARRGHLPGRAPRRRQRPGRHPDGGDHQPDGRLGERLVQDDQRHAGAGRPDGPPDAPAHHQLRHPVSGASRGRHGQRRRLPVSPRPPDGPAPSGGLTAGSPGQPAAPARRPGARPEVWCRPGGLVPAGGVSGAGLEFRRRPGGVASPEAARLDRERISHIGV